MNPRICLLFALVRFHLSQSLPSPRRAHFPGGRLRLCWRQAKRVGGSPPEGDDMPTQMTNAATIACSFGVAPTPLTVLPVNRVMAGGQPAATIMDHVPMVNVMPFGMCSSPQNPTVIAATAAALGVLTPMPCVPATVTPWTPGVPTTMVGGMPVLNETCKLACMWGGLIQFVAPAQVTVQV
jgi:hypothetical protein